MTTTSQEILDKFTEKFREYENPATASGQCFISTEKVINFFEGKYSAYSGLQMAYARHHNDPDGRYYKLGQYSNHFATYVPSEKLVVDFTMRQFASRTAWPWVGTYPQWLNLLARAWDVPSHKHLTHKRNYTEDPFNPDNDDD